MRDDLLEWLKPSEPIKDITGRQAEFLQDEKIERRRVSSNVDIVCRYILVRNIECHPIENPAYRLVETWYEDRTTHRPLPFGALKNN